MTAFKHHQTQPPQRHYEQSMGLWINESTMDQPGAIERSIRDLAQAGYDTLRIFVRHSNYTHVSPEIVAVVGGAVHLAHALGMRATLDCEPHALIGNDMIRRYPAAAGSKLVRLATRVVDGQWLVRGEELSSGGSPASLSGIEAAFLRQDGCLRKIELEYTDSRGTQLYRNGGIHRELLYKEGVPMAFHRLHEIRGVLPGVADAELVVYLRHDTRSHADFWAADFRRYFDELLECYRQIPLDGVGWDEPAYDGNWGSYRYGPAFAEAFERINGYRLADQLYLLDEPGMSPEAVKVRLDYYRTLNEGLAQAQSNLIDKAHAIFGKHLLLGTHHTWQGEGGSGDYRAGAVDYFRLNDRMDAGYTDCSWWDPDAVAYAYTLGSSLGRLTPSGETEANTWHYRPTVSNIRTNVNLMTLMNITWFNIWFGHDCDCVLQQGHYTWPITAAAMRSHRDHQRRIGKRRPVVEVAIWHGWEGVCGWNRPGLANSHKAFCLNTSRLFIERNIAADFIDSRLLAQSRIENGQLVNALGAYRVLIVPFALAISRQAFERCAEFARAGGRVLFTGTPVAFDEQGQSLAQAFADLLGMPETTAEHYMAGIDAICTLPNYRPQRLEVCRPLASGLPRALVSCEGENHGVTSEDGNALFLTDLDPHQRLIERIEDRLSQDVQSYGDNLLWRLYRGEKGDLLVIVAREDRPMRGIIRWGKKLIEISGGSVGLLEKSGEKLAVTGDAVWHENQ